MVAIEVRRGGRRSGCEPVARGGDPAPPPVEPDAADGDGPRDLSPPVLIDTAGIGPPIPSAPSIGEVMLTDLTSDARRGARIVLVIIPNVPRGFEAVAR